MMKHVTSTDGTSIAYERRGTGPALLLVHGTTADHRRWAQISSRLEEHFTVCSIDRRGRGESGDGPDYTLMREAEDIAAVVADIGPPVSILGHSYGALCSLEAALLTEVERLILYEPPVPTGVPLYPPGVPERMQSLIERGEWEPALEMMLREVVGMPQHELEQFRRQPMWPVRVQLAPTIPREMQVERSYSWVPARFAELRVPTMLLLGGDSPRVFRDGIEALAEALQNSSIVELPGQQHIAMDTAPDLFLREVLAFLQP
jgi:pimeloyl-ACP methyl ester carboxylesterase